MQALILIAGILIIIYNLFVNVSNLNSLASHALRYNTTNGYWEAYFKNCVSLRAIISSVVGTIFAFILFVILEVMILFRGEAIKKEINLAKSTGLKFFYENDNSWAEKTAFFETNIHTVGFDKKSIQVTGVVRLDFAQILTFIKTECENKSLPLSYEVMQEIKLGADTATVPFLVNIKYVDYPLYVIYTQEQLMQFRTVKDKFAAAGISDVLYFSAIPFQITKEATVQESVETRPGLA